VACWLTNGAHTETRRHRDGFTSAHLRRMRLRQRFVQPMESPGWRLSGIDTSMRVLCVDSQQEAHRMQRTHKIGTRLTQPNIDPILGRCPNLEVF
jgi:hypothetical protein